MKAIFVLIHALQSPVRGFRTVKTRGRPTL
jgi:hypothetical protein